MGLDWDQTYKNIFFDLKKKKSVTIITCCYDLIPILFPQYCVGNVAHYFKEYFAALTWGSSGVLCISNNSQKDYLELCRSSGWPTPPTCVIPLGDSLPQETGEVSKDIQRLCTEPLILFVSTIERRKNHQCLVQAYHILRRTQPDLILPKLVFVGMQGWGVGDLLMDIELDPLTKNFIVLLNHVTDAELSLLYKSATFCVYPSFYEGWGLPLGEALAMGKAVYSSNAGSLPEVGGELVKYISPYSPDDWASEIHKAVSEPNSIEELSNKVKSNYVAREWSNAANITLDFATKCRNHDSPKSNNLIFYPGYELSTHSGTHKGPSIISRIGESGFLMFGPFITLETGNYKVDVSGICELIELGDLIFNICYGESRNETINIIQDEEIECIISNKTEKLIWSTEFSINNITRNLQVRCINKNSKHLEITKIKIIKITSEDYNIHD
jgi:glycosyltransferase involved in cell wall biosynthesis